MKDKTGRELKVGQVVDVFVSDAMHALVTDVHEGGSIVAGDGRPQPACLMVTIQIPIRLNPGEPAPVYIILEPKPKSDKPKSALKVM